MEPQMDPEAAKNEAKFVKARYGATHYTVMKDGVTPQLYYKQESVRYNEGSSEMVWVYLNFYAIWNRSAITEVEVARLIEIN